MSKKLTSTIPATISTRKRFLSLVSGVVVVLSSADVQPVRADYCCSVAVTNASCWSKNPCNPERGLTPDPTGQNV